MMSISEVIGVLAAFGVVVLSLDEWMGDYLVQVQYRQLPYVHAAMLPVNKQECDALAKEVKMVSTVYVADLATGVGFEE